MNVLAHIETKAAINCDDLFELWNSVNDKIAEYALLFFYSLIEKYCARSQIFYFNLSFNFDVQRSLYIELHSDSDSNEMIEASTMYLSV